MKNIKFIKNIYSVKRIELVKLSLKHLDDIHEYSKDERFFKVTDNQKGNIEVYKYKDGTLDIEYAVFGQNFKKVNDAFKYLNNLKGVK